MPKNKMDDPITDQEITFARLILAGSMTDQRAAEVAGLNPATAAYTKSKPRVRAYMIEHRAAMQEQLVQQETESLGQLNLAREQVLARLWEIAKLSPETTRGNIAGQVKALAMIVAIQGLIPSRRAARPDGPPDILENQPAATPNRPDIYVAAWLRKQQAEANAGALNPHATDPMPEEETAPDRSPVEPTQDAATAAPDPASPKDEPVVVNHARPTTQWVPDAVGEHDTREPFWTKRNGFGRRR